MPDSLPAILAEFRRRIEALEAQVRELEEMRTQPKKKAANG